MPDNGSSDDDERATADRPATPDVNVGVLMFVSYRAMENRVFQAIAAAGFADLTPAQARILQRIGPAGTRLTDLAEQAQVTKQSAGFLVDQLVGAGYVERTSDPLDARARLIRISGRGLAAQPIADAVVADVEAEWAAHLGPAQWTALRRALTALRGITDPYS
jgi:DNA-binding MarR family transcriptional regulator